MFIYKQFVSWCVTRLSRVFIHFNKCKGFMWIIAVGVGFWWCEPRVCSVIGMATSPFCLRYQKMQVIKLNITSHSSTFNTVHQHWYSILKYTTSLVLLESRISDDIYWSLELSTSSCKLFLFLWIKNQKITYRIYTSHHNKKNHWIMFLKIYVHICCDKQA